MSNNNTDIKTVEEQIAKTELLPSGESILEQLSISSLKIKSIKPRWKRSNYIAIINWLTEYQANSDDSNFEKVRGYLEAFYHLATVGNWETARNILCISVNNRTQKSLHNQLGIWGYYTEQIDIYRQSIGKLKNKPGYLWDSICLSGIGNSYLPLGNLEKALHYHKQHLGIASIVKDNNSKGLALGNLGLVYDLLGDYPMAIECHEQSLKISQDYGERQREGETFENLGSAYYCFIKPI